MQLQEACSAKKFGRGKSVKVRDSARLRPRKNDQWKQEARKKYTGKKASEPGRITQHKVKAQRLEFVSKDSLQVGSLCFFLETSFGGIGMSNSMLEFERGLSGGIPGAPEVGFPPIRMSCCLLNVWEEIYMEACSRVPSAWCCCIGDAASATLTRVFLNTLCFEGSAFAGVRWCVLKKRNGARECWGMYDSPRHRVRELSRWMKEEYKILVCDLQRSAVKREQSAGQVDRTRYHSRTPPPPAARCHQHNESLKMCCGRLGA